MSKTWIQDYILLALRIDKVMQATQIGQFVEAYYGPSGWEEQVDVEAEMSPNELVRQAMSLEDALSAQGFPIFSM